MCSSKSLVLKPIFDENTLFDRLEQCIKSWFDRFDLFLLHDETIEDESGIVTTIWRDEVRPDFELRLTFDDAVPMTYLSVVGDDQSDVETLTNDLAGHFRIYTPEELIPDALLNLEDLEVWTRLAISLNGQYNEQVESVLLANLSSLNADRLAVAATAIALLRWSSFIEPLHTTLSTSIPEDVRSVLVIALQACES